ncbi:MAG: hypothetical protein PVF17_00980 [Ignavibacteria bacterium]|jgi:hypothetical protein
MTIFITAMWIAVVVMLLFFIVFLFCAFCLNRLSEDEDRRRYEEAEMTKKNNKTCITKEKK